MKKLHSSVELPDFTTWHPLMRDMAEKLLTSVRRDPQFTGKLTKGDNAVIEFGYPRYGEPYIAYRLYRTRLATIYPDRVEFRTYGSPTTRRHWWQHIHQTTGFDLAGNYNAGLVVRCDASLKQGDDLRGATLYATNGVITFRPKRHRLVLDTTTANPFGKDGFKVLESQMKKRRARLAQRRKMTAAFRDWWDTRQQAYVAMVSAADGVRGHENVGMVRALLTCIADKLPCPYTATWTFDGAKAIFDADLDHDFANIPATRAQYASWSNPHRALHPVPPAKRGMILSQPPAGWWDEA